MNFGLEPLPATFYRRKTSVVAKALLGKSLFHFHNGQLTGGVIIETEAYLGLADPACHSFHGKRTPRIASMYLEGGHSYVYLIYGLHFCFNVVTRSANDPEAVLIRALLPTHGLEQMYERRRFTKEKSLRELSSGPGKLCQALGIDRSCDALSLQGPRLWISEAEASPVLRRKVEAGPRVGIDYAGEAKHWPLRYRLSVSE